MGEGGGGGGRLLASEAAWVPAEAACAPRMRTGSPWWSQQVRGGRPDWQGLPARRGDPSTAGLHPGGRDLPPNLYLFTESAGLPASCLHREVATHMGYAARLFIKALS